MAGPVRLAPDGVWRAAASPRRWWALTPPFHPYRRRLLKTRRRRSAFCSTFRRLSPPGLRQRPALRCPDFPRPAATALKQYCGRPRSPGLHRNRSACHERTLVGELAAALGAEDAAARVHDELAAGEALERRAAQQGGQLLVERPVQRGDVHLYSS